MLLLSVTILTNVPKLAKFAAGKLADTKSRMESSQIQSQRLNIPYITSKLEPQGQAQNPTKSTFSFQNLHRRYTKGHLVGPSNAFFSHSD